MDPQTNSFFGELYTRYYLDLFRYAKSYVREDALAQEIVQEAFVILLTQQSTLEQHPNILGWLVTVVRNQAVSELRRRKKCTAVPLEELAAVPAAPHEPSLRDTLPRGLSDEDCRLIMLRYEEQLSHEEIAQTLGISVMASRARLHRAQKLCARLLKDEERKEALQNGTSHRH